MLMKSGFRANMALAVFVIKWRKGAVVHQLKRLRIFFKILAQHIGFFLHPNAVSPFAALPAIYPRRLYTLNTLPVCLSLECYVCVCPH